jgi:diguanylate cyclase (GGDEF)-like protein
VTSLLHDPDVRAIVLNARDVTERKVLEEQLRHQALHDPLTGLGNRALLRDRLQHALRRQARRDPDLALLLIDLDDFKDVNDGYGHAAGDLVLCEVTARLRDCLRTGDTLARLGGDEFAVILEDGGADEAEHIAHRVISAVHAPFDLPNGETVAVGASASPARAPPAWIPTSCCATPTWPCTWQRLAGRGPVSGSPSPCRSAWSNA